VCGALNKIGVREGEKNMKNLFNWLEIVHLSLDADEGRSSKIKF